MKTLYLFGAGSSFKTIPLVKDLPNSLELFANQINEFDKKNNDTNLQFNSLTSSYKIIANQARKFGTIDTYFQYLFESKNRSKEISYNYAKILLSFYFSFIQLNKDVHNRLFYFLTKTNKIINANNSFQKTELNFITWNYDFQLELAISELNEIETENMSRLIDIYPVSNDYNIEKNNLKIIHLNGIAGFFNVRNSDSYNLFDSKSFFDKSFDSLFKKLISFWDIRSITRTKTDNFFTFNFESTQNKKNLFEYTYNLIENCDYLIIIGYSFPIDNRDFDKKWMNSLDENCQIVLQDPQPSQSTKLFLSEHKNVSYITEIDQYYIPSELIKNDHT